MISQGYPVEIYSTAVLATCSILHPVDIRSNKSLYSTSGNVAHFIIRISIETFNQEWFEYELKGIYRWMIGQEKDQTWQDVTEKEKCGTMVTMLSESLRVSQRVYWVSSSSSRGERQGFRANGDELIGKFGCLITNGTLRTHPSDNYRLHAVMAANWFCRLQNVFIGLSQDFQGAPRLLALVTRPLEDGRFLLFVIWDMSFLGGRRFSPTGPRVRGCAYWSIIKLFLFCRPSQWAQTICHESKNGHWGGGGGRWFSILLISYQTHTYLWNGLKGRQKRT